MTARTPNPARHAGWRRLAGLVLATAAMLWSALGPTTAAHAEATGLPEEPQLRVEPEAHTALVREAAYDAHDGRLYSVSDDKTVRVWQLPQGRLLDTWRVPIAAGHEGQLFGAALSPDGRWLAVGGYTGWAAEQTSCVYLFDTRSGTLARRLQVAPHTITTLRFSPDGQHLAVGLHGLGGLAVVAMSDGRVVATDPDYRGKLMGMEYDRSGHLVTVSLDGFVRYYRADYSLLARLATQAGHEPDTIAISPDGKTVAIGFLDAPVVELRRGTDLEALRTLRLPAAHLTNSVSVEWADGGRSLFVSGEARGTARQSILRFTAGRWDAPQRIAGPVQRVNDLLSLGDGRLLFTSEDPGLGWIERSGRLHWISRPELIDFSAAADGLRISTRGDRVSFPLGRDGGTARYEVAQARFVRAGAGGTALRPTLKQAPGLVVQMSTSPPSLQVNGHAVALDEAEEPRVQAVSADGQRAYIGTEWALRAVDANGAPRWVLPLNATVRAVNASADGHLVLALLGDGTLRWYRADDGRELLALFVHANRRDWISWTPAGHYASSPQGDQHIGWHLNRGPDRSPDFIRAVQLERVLYRPDRVAAALDDGSPGGAATRGGEPTLQRERLQSVAPPRVQVQVLGVDAERATARVAVQAERAGTSGPGIRDLAVYVNDIPVVATRDRNVGVFDRVSLKREFTVPLSQPWNEIRVEAFSDNSLGLARTGVELPTLPTPPQAGPTGDLYVLAIGASRFDLLGEPAQLAYAAKDAEVLAAELGASTALSFRQRHVRVLSDASPQRPTRANIVAALDFLGEAQANDTVVVFLASHGVADAAGNYFFVPADARPQDLQGRVAVADPGSLLSWQVFFDALRRAAGRRILVVDTCAAKGIAGPIEATSLIKRSASSHFALMLASGENEESQEYEAGGHGLFTFSLLSVLRHAAAHPAAGLTLDTWFQDALPLVRRLRDRRVGPQTPQLLAPPSLLQMPLAAAAY